MDIGSTLANNISLTEDGQVLVERLNFLISSVVTQEEFTVYRGITNLDVSPIETVSETYGGVTVLRSLRLTFSLFLYISMVVVRARH